MIGVGDADACVVDQEPEHDLVGSVVLLHDREVDLARFGELHGVADQIDQHLAHAERISVKVAVDIRINDGPELDTLRRGALGEDFGNAVDQLVEIEVHRLDAQLPGLDLGEIENVVDQREQRVGAGADGGRVFALLAGERGGQEKVRHSDHAVHRRADLMAHVGQEL